MSFIIAIERRHWKTRLLYAAMYLLVTVGSLTMVYPFLIMLSGSLKCRTDFDRFEIIPSYLRDDALLFRKFERARYNGNIWRYQIATRREPELFEDIQPPERVNERAARDVADFLESDRCPPDFITLGQAFDTGVQPRMLRRFRQFLFRRFGGDLASMNDALGLAARSWDDVSVPEVALLSRGNQRAHTPLEDLYYAEFRPAVPRREFWPVNVEGIFASGLRARFRRDIAAFNARYGTRFADFGQVPFSRTRPVGVSWAAEWDAYVREDVNLRFLMLRPSALASYRRFLRGRYGDVAAYNRTCGASVESFDQAPMPDRWPQVGPAGRDWQAFIQGGDALDHVEIDSFEFRYRDFLRDRYGSLDALNRAHGEQYGSFEAVPLRLEQYDAWLLRSRRGEVVWEFLSRNYLHALDYLLLRGRAFWVTLVYCVLNVLGHLIVNPLAAYTLSRYRLRQAHWVLLFCLVTMAFPAEVGSIPRFLLIREMGLLNTLGALILPGLAHGFSIFILKGFFDGLPKELYEAAVIEGAPERWMFWNVTLSLTKPILAVTAFGSFLSAYGAFMFALMICPDKRMWTISVWLYQFQQGVTEPVAFAALALASVPVLAAFLLAQKFIIQGIVLPVEK